MIFDRNLCNVYITDNSGNIIKGKVTECSISTGYDMQPTLRVECTDIMFMQKSMKDIDPNVFQALLEDENGGCTEVPEEVAEETAEEVEP